MFSCCCEFCKAFNVRNDCVRLYNCWNNAYVLLFKFLLLVSAHIADLLVIFNVSVALLENLVLWRLRLTVDDLFNKGLPLLLLLLPLLWCTPVGIAPVERMTAQPQTMQRFTLACTSDRQPHSFIGHVSKGTRKWSGNIYLSIDDLTTLAELCMQRTVKRNRA
jgi:hypothetical protein